MRVLTLTELTTAVSLHQVSLIRAQYKKNCGSGNGVLYVAAAAGGSCGSLWHGHFHFPTAYTNVCPSVRMHAHTVTPSGAGNGTLTL